MSERVLAVTVIQLSSSTTGVRTDGEAVWIVPRPASEKLPARVAQIYIRSKYPGKRAIVSVRVTGRAKVRKIVSWFNALGVRQPGVYHCPHFRPSPIVIFGFRGPGGRLLARATDFGGDSGPCNPIGFTLRGRRQEPLVGNFVTRVQRLLGVRFYPPPQGMH